MLERFFDYIRHIFGLKRTSTNAKQQEENQNYADEYMDISKVNFNAIFANKLATLTLSDSTLGIAEDNKRASLLNGCVQNVWKKAKKITAAALATGGCLIVPYVKNGKILFNIVKQNRLAINSRDGEKITNATVIADSIVINNNLYYRLTNYAVVGNTLHITNKAVSAYGSPASVDEWADIVDVSITGVDRVLFGFIKSPVDNRKSSDDYGVPITYGCKKIISEIEDCLTQIKDEYELKGVRLQVDERLLKKDPKTGKAKLDDKLFMAGHGLENKELFNIFDPAIRDSAFYSRLQSLFELFEKQVGTSKGILTAKETKNATATEIKDATGDTFAIVTDIRKAIEVGIEDYIYACNVLANYYNLSPMGEYEIKYDWSYSMIESSTETFMQMKDLQSVGALSKAELRCYVTGEDIETAEKAIEEITKKEPPLSSLMGMSE